VRIGRGALAALVRDLAARRPARAVVVSDSNVAPLHARPLVRALRGRGLSADLVVFPAGERHKTRRTKAAIEDRLAALGADRDTTIVAVGGGVTCDLAGFVAATWHRGIPIVHAPTSLLAMVDAALGGKTGVNVPGGKNLVGSYHPPRGVYADPRTLGTLPRERFVEGLAEVVKTAVVADARLFGWLERRACALVARDPAAVEHAIVAAARAKVRLVARDERDRGPRLVLNFGHTVGHAIEAASGYTISHGRAVAIGLVAEARIAARRTGLAADDVARIERLLAALGLPRRLPSRIPVAAVLDATAADKKSRGGAPRCALPRGLGRPGVGRSVTVAVTRAELRAGLARGVD
jgi:3-dehydroquinate synthase